jgi:hypothetical protein
MIVKERGGKFWRNANLPILNGSKYLTAKCKLRVCHSHVNLDKSAPNVIEHLALAAPWGYPSRQIAYRGLLAEFYPRPPRIHFRTGSEDDAC